MKNEFTCPSGHSFNAVAKLRARCPHCGLMARRNFENKNEPVEQTEPVEKIEKKVEVQEKPKVQPKQRKPVIVKQGKPLPKKRPPIVRRKIVKKSLSIPKVKKLPVGSRERKVAEIVQPKSFWEQVKEQFFR